MKKDDKTGVPNSYIKDFLSADTLSALRKVKSLVTFTADKVGDITGFAGEILTGTHRDIIDKKVEGGVEDIMSYAGYCISDVAVGALMDDARNSALLAVTYFKLDDFVDDGVDDVFNFACEIEDFVKETHLPPTPCCYLISTVCNKLNKP
ncbi:MAG: hypothetical protein H7844_12255 [Nitrospirae bacterium YQR-1]